MLDLIFSDKITVHWIVFSILNYIILERLGIQTRISPKVIEKYIEKEKEKQL